MERIKVIALFGPSGAGKDTIQRWMIEKIPNLHKIILHTTRPKRNYEKEDQDYHFISTADFLDLMDNKRIIDCTVFNEWFYGIDINEFVKDKINIGVFNPQSIRQLIMNQSHKFDILPIWIQSHDKQRLLRNLKREQSPNCSEICRRFLADEKDFANINFPYEIYLNDNPNQIFDGILKKPKVRDFLKMA